jgi:hypothetical protein
MRLNDLASDLNSSLLSEAVFSGNFKELISEWNAMQQEASKALGGISVPKIISPIKFRWISNCKGAAKGGDCFGYTPTGKDFVSTLPFIEKHQLEKKDIDASALDRDYYDKSRESAEIAMRILILATATGYYDSESPFMYEDGYDTKYYPEWNKEKVNKLLEKQDQKKWYETLSKDAQKHVDSKTVKGKYNVYVENPFRYEALRFWSPTAAYVSIVVYPSPKTLKQFVSAIKRAAKKEKINLDPTYGAPKYDDFVKANQDADAAVERADSDDRLNNDENIRKMANELRREFDKGGIREPQYQYNLVDLYDKITGALNRYSVDHSARAKATEYDVEKNAKEITQKYKSLVSMTSKLVSAIDKKLDAIGPKVEQKWSVAITNYKDEVYEVIPDYPSYKKAVVSAKGYTGRPTSDSIYVVEGTQVHFKPLGTTKEGSKNARFFFVKDGDEEYEE